MERLGLWVREVITILFFITLVEALSPLRFTRNYVRLATGLVLVLALLRPILQVPATAGGEELWLGFYRPGTAPDAPDWGLLENAQRRQALALYAEALRVEAQRVAMTVPGVSGAVVRVEVDADLGSPEFGALRRLRVGVAGEPGAAAAVGDALATGLQVPRAQVEVEEIR
ncbi:MAG: stage III sporulation protein AF [bacterium]|nr:stage III sporulation protein AF [bacterium]